MGWAKLSYQQEVLVDSMMYHNSTTLNWYLIYFDAGLSDNDPELNEYESHRSMKCLIVSYPSWIISNWSVWYKASLTLYLDNRRLYQLTLIQRDWRAVYFEYHIGCTSIFCLSQLIHEFIQFIERISAVSENPRMSFQRHNSPLKN